MSTPSEIEEVLTKYLRSRHQPPLHSFSLEKLSGGLVNYVYRVRGETSDIVLKHYRSYLSSDPSVSLSCERYFVEKAALQVLTREAEQRVSTIARTPKLLHFDDDLHTLSIEDFGSNLISFFDYCIFLQNNPSSFSENTIDRLVNAVFELEHRLRAITNCCKPDQLRQFYSAGTNDMINNYVFGEFGERAQSLPALQSYIPLVERSRKRREHTSQALLADNFNTLPSRFQIVFGDLWPNALFLLQESQPRTSAVPEVIILDFEFVQIDNPRGDYFQLLAYLCLMESDPQYFLPAVEGFKQKLLKRMFAEDSSPVREDEVALFLCDIALVIRDDRWTFALDLDTICERAVAFVESLLPAVKREEWRS